jgi:hypothetical protein
LKSGNSEHFMKKINLLFTLVTTCFISFSFTGEKGNKIKNDLSELNLKGKVKTLTEIEYKVSPNTGKIKEGDMLYKYIYSFNENGNLIETNSYDPDGNLDGKYTYSYDNIKGNKTEMTSYNPDGSSDERCAYKYDSKGNLIQEIWYYPDGSISKKYNYKYDDKGNEIAMNRYDFHDSLICKDSYKYNDKGEKIEWNHFNLSPPTDGTLSKKVIFKYDEKENINVESIYLADGSFECFSYKYDYKKKGNWKKETIYKNGLPQYITERNIKYY